MSEEPLMLSERQEALVAASSASCGGLVSTLLLYPLDIVKTRLAAELRQARNKGEGVKASATLLTVAARLLRQNGPAGLYKGVQYRVAQSMAGKFLYFYFYSFLTSYYESRMGDLTTVPNLVVGYLSELMHLPFTLPLEVIVTRLQTAASGGGSAAALPTIVGNIVREGGYAALWRGWHAYPFIALQPAINYTAFERLKALYLSSRGVKGSGATLSTTQAFLLGALARALAVLVTFPFTRARTLIQAKRKQKADQVEPEEASAAAAPSVLSVLRRIVEAEGPSGLYKGVKPELLRGVLSSAVMLMVKERITLFNRQLVHTWSP